MALSLPAAPAVLLSSELFCSTTRLARPQRSISLTGARSSRTFRNRRSSVTASIGPTPGADEYGDEKEAQTAEGKGEEKGEEKKEEKKDDKESESGSGSDNLKLSLVDALYGTKRGFRASAETRAEIAEIVGQLEQNNPTEAPTEAADLLNGKWLLAYTSFSELSSLLAIDYIPLLKVGEITQFINSKAQLLTNAVTLEGPVSSSLIEAEATYEVRSPKRIQVKFEEAVLGSPEVTSDPEVPRSAVIMGEKVDLSPLLPVLRPARDAAIGLVRFLAGQPPVKIDIRGQRNASSWLLTTYLDEELRISRGDGGSLFVLVKAGSNLAAQLL